MEGGREGGMEGGREGGREAKSHQRSSVLEVASWVSSSCDWLRVERDDVVTRCWGLGGGGGGGRRSVGEREGEYTYLP